MGLFLTLAFLFFIGSVAGWVLELVFRKFFSDANPEHKWINPGFCTGPYVPLYGSGLCLLFLIASLEDFSLIYNSFLNKLVLFLLMAVTMTLIEYIAGVFLLRYFNLRLWDYSREWGNYKGVICPIFSAAWAFLGAIYYFLVHPHILEALHWLSNNLAFSFVIGLFFGFFIVDVSHSMQLVTVIKRFAEENQVVLRYENVKAHIRSHMEHQALRYQFFRPFRSDRPLREHLKEMLDSLELRMK